MSVDHSSSVKAPKSDPVFLHVKAGVTCEHFTYGVDQQ
tara:strand:+ start:1108 stop:1221 length:114 start_codon:yes stop_codon:yes gene_type:complete